MTNRITVRKGEKPLLVIDGTGDASNLWLCDPIQKGFFSYSVENQQPKTGIYQRKDKGWIGVSIGQAEPTLGWQRITDRETVKLLNAMEKAVLLWIRKGGHAASA